MEIDVKWILFLKLSWSLKKPELLSKISFWIKFMKNYGGKFHLLLPTIRFTVNWFYPVSSFKLMKFDWTSSPIQKVDIVTVSSTVIINWILYVKKTRQLKDLRKNNIFKISKNGVTWLTHYNFTSLYITLILNIIADNVTSMKDVHILDGWYREKRTQHIIGNRKTWT